MAAFLVLAQFKFEYRGWSDEEFPGLFLDTP